MTGVMAPPDKYTERGITKILMRWLMLEKKHLVAIPNSTTLFRWEADMASITKSLYSHEIEIKISKADYARDKKKVWKHQHLINSQALPPMNYTSPNYFWYCTPEGIEIEVPDYAGWLVVSPWGSRFVVEEKKPAPRLHSVKMSDKAIACIARLLSFRLMSEMK